MRASWYVPFAAALAAAGFHAAVTELRGHEAAAGARRPGRRYDFDYADLLADLRAALTVVRAELPSAPVVLAGHSMGGQLASVLLASDPDAAAALVLLASGTPHWRVWGPWQLVRTQAAHALAVAVGHFPGARVGFAGREARGVVRDWAGVARNGRFAVGRPARSSLPGLAVLRLPVLAVTVEGDGFGPRRAAHALLRLMPKATTESVHVLPAPGDEPLDHFRWARRPELVVPPLAAWLARYVVAEQETSDRP
jgi:predicted alpha/beta hydrolase